MFDTSKVFGISACVLLISLSDKILSSDICDVYIFEYPKTIKTQFKNLNGKIYSNLEKFLIVDAVFKLVLQRTIGSGWQRGRQSEGRVCGWVCV